MILLYFLFFLKSFALSVKPLVGCVSCDLLSDPFPFFTSLFCNDKIANYLADD